MSFIAETGSGHLVAMDGRLTAAAATSLRDPWKCCSSAPAAAPRTTWS